MILIILIMKDDNDKIITRSQKKKLETEKGQLSFDFLKCSITRSILKYLYNDISKYGEDFKIFIIHMCFIFGNNYSHNKR